MARTKPGPSATRTPAEIRARLPIIGGAHWPPVPPMIHPQALQYGTGPQEPRGQVTQPRGSRKRFFGLI